MKRNIIIFLIISLLAHHTHTLAQERVVIDFNKGWKFNLGDDSAAMQPHYDDAHWRQLNLPHDWSIEGNFSQSHPATEHGGALPGGIGWYRKEFTLPPLAENKKLMIEFDGVYRNSRVYINGHLLGERPNGYISFHYDLTPYINPSGKNVIAVRVNNSRQPDSRWYTGSGIYRNVRLVAGSKKAAVAPWGIFIHTPDVDSHQAKVQISVALEGAALVSDSIFVLTNIYDADGRMVVPGNKVPVKCKRKLDTAMTTSLLTLTNPQLWSPDRPYQYKAVTRVFYHDTMTDEITTAFGVRYFRFDRDKGFFLNGKPLKIRGVCNHHDLGALGAAVNVRAIERQLEILKAMGANAIRTAHNPPAPELLELCDRMGFLVMVEAFDMWRKKKNKYDYHADFDEWHQRDLESMVLRDRNHPSVFMWSIGNEIREQFDSSGIRITRELVKMVKALDSTRPVVAALSEWNPEKNFMYQSGALDLVGLNYHHEVYEDFHKHYPGKIFIGTEQMSALATRGHYDFPSDSTYFWPARSPQRVVENGNPDHTVSAYDQVAAYWGSTHEQTWKIIKKHDFLSGLFVWTGFDYLGEPIPYGWPSRSSYYGIIDLAGFPKDAYYMYQSEWTSQPVLHVFPHWNWQPGQLVDIWAYYNQADEVELFLNNRSLGAKQKTNDELHVMWRVPYEPGTLRAVSRKNGKVVLTKEISTAGAPARIELVADRKVIRADGKDLSFITVRIVDKAGNLVPDAGNLVQFSATGAGAIVGTDNGYQADTTSLKSPERKCWKGMALVIVQAGEKKGNITLKAVSEGLPAASITLKTR